VGWDNRLGRFDAIVSNNALFLVWPERLGCFYESCFARLKGNGIMLNQQSFAYEPEVSLYGNDPFPRFMQALPESILPRLPQQTAAERRRLAIEKRHAEEEHRRALERAEAAGVEFREDRGYQFLTVQEHLQAMRRAGFACGCMWRKREFAVLLGVKGQPLARGTA
jgi:cyclopropane fatty-acyl-phospholipid synthase-like methyltransferase